MKRRGKDDFRDWNRFIDAGLWALAGVTAGTALGKAYHLNARCFPPLMLLCWLLFYTSQRGRKLRGRQEQEFQGLIRYMEQFIYLFRRTPRIGPCLRSLKLLVDSPFRELTEEGERSAAQGQEALAAWLEEMEKRYPLAPLRELHRFLREIEAEGGEYGGGLDLLLQEIRGFAAREAVFHQELDQLRGRLKLCFLLSLLLGLGASNLLPQSREIYELTLYRLGSMFLLTGTLLGALLTDVLLSVPWGQVPPPLSEAQINRLRGRLRGGCSRRTYFLLLAGSLLLCVFCIRQGYRAAAVPAVFLFLFQLVKPLRDRRTAKTRLTEEALRQLPQWLEELAILLQTRTVQTGLTGMMRTSVPIVRCYLKELVRDLEEDPISPEPYRRFMQELELPRVREAMVLLYSLNGTGRAFAREQLEALSRKNRELLAERETLRRRDKSVWIALLGFIPMSLTVIKLLVDLTLSFLVFLRAL